MTDITQQDERAALQAQIRRLQADLESERAKVQRERRSNGELALLVHELREQVNASDAIVDQLGLELRSVKGAGVARESTPAEATDAAPAEAKPVVTKNTCKTTARRIVNGVPEYTIEYHDGRVERLRDGKWAEIAAPAVTNDTAPQLTPERVAELAQDDADTRAAMEVQRGQ